MEGHGRDFCRGAYNYGYCLFAGQNRKVMQCAGKPPAFDDGKEVSDEIYCTGLLS